MANGYFNPTPTTIPTGVRALAAQVNNIASSISLGFDKLPTEAELKLGTTRYAVDSGVADAYIVALPYVPSLTDGFNFSFKASNANTGAATINVNATGIKSIVNPDGSALIAGTFGLNAIVILAFESIGDRYILVSQNPAQAALAQSSAIAAAASAAAALVSENNSATSESNASTSETNAAASFDSFDDRYLGEKASDPALDNDGNPLISGALYWNSTDNPQRMYGYDLANTQWDAVFLAGDATTLDSIDSTQFLRSDIADTFTGVLTIAGSITGATAITATTFNGALNGDASTVGGVSGSSILRTDAANTLTTGGTTSDALAISETTLTSGSLLSLLSNNAGKTGSLLSITQDHASSVADGLTIQQDGTGNALDITQNGLAAAVSITHTLNGTALALINTNGAATAADLLTSTLTATAVGGAAVKGIVPSLAVGNAVYAQSLGVNGNALLVQALNVARTDAVAYINQQDTSAAADTLELQQASTGGRGLYAYSNAATRSVPLVEIVNDNATGSLSSRGLQIQQDSPANALQILHNGLSTGGEDCINILANALTTSAVINMNADDLTTGWGIDIDVGDTGNMTTGGGIRVVSPASGTGNAAGGMIQATSQMVTNAFKGSNSDVGGRAAYFTSNVASRTAPVVEILNDQTTGTGVALLIKQDMGGPSIEMTTRGWIKFPATNVVSTDKNTLDDYQEDSLTPDAEDDGGTTSATYAATPTGNWTKVGNRVFFDGRINILTLGDAEVTQQFKVRMGGMPNISSEGIVNVGLGLTLALPTAGTYITGLVASGNVISFLKWSATGGTTDLLWSDVGSTGLLTFSGHYETAA